jgi:hypothetical protein
VAEDLILDELWRRGASDREIAEKTGRSQKAVEARRTSLGLVDEPEEPDAPLMHKRTHCQDLFKKWDAWNTRLRERLMAETAYPFDAP